MALRIQSAVRLSFSTLVIVGSLVLPLLQPAAQAQTNTSTPSASTSRVRWTPKPERGNAQGTLSGGRRGGEIMACGSQANDSSLRLLVPAGRESLLTTQAQPTLAWQVKTQQPVEMELIVSDVTQANPIFTQRLTASQTEMIQVKLPADAALDLSKQYRWTVVAHCPTGQKAEIYSRSFIRRVSRESLGQQPGDTQSQAPLELAMVSAQQGIWYDALAHLLESPGQLANGTPTGALAELLGQAQTTAP
jgi:hypothetical protein